MQQRRRGDSGAVAVEAALLLPLVTLIILGIVEFGLLFRDVLTVQTAARDAARTASAHSRDPDYVAQALERVKQSMSIRSPQDTDRILIYKAFDERGLPEGADSATAALAPGGCSIKCASYHGDAAGDYVPLGGSGWSAADQNACPDEGREYVGVIVAIDHAFITGQIGAMFTGGSGDSKMVFEKVVMRLEPRPASSTDDCKPTP